MQLKTVTPRDSLAYKFISLLGKQVIFVVEWLIRKFGDEAYQEPEWARELAVQSETMRFEFYRLYDEQLREFRDISPEQERITLGSSWKVFIFMAYGRRLQSNCDKCPQTTELCLKIPGIKSLSFSVLEAGTKIAPHRGVYSGVLRCLIPILIPDGDCGMRIENKEYRWQLGSPLVFDDTKEHESWNLSSGRRVVLFIDFVRRLPFPLNIMNRLIILTIAYSPFIGRMLRKSL